MTSILKATLQSYNGGYTNLYVTAFKVYAAAGTSFFQKFRKQVHVGHKKVKIKMSIIVHFEKVKKKLTEPSLIDNVTFQLHYKVTFTILIACTILACASTYFGHPIQCMHQKKDLKDLVNNYCWVLATFTIPAQLTGVGINMPHPGLGQTTDPNLLRITEDGDEIRHAFYQFVCIVLFIQAAMFKIPQYIWRSWEDGKIKMMVKELNNQSLDPELTKKKAESRLASERYFVRTQGSHQSYVRGYVFCEMLNFVIVIVQIWFMNWFLGGQFLTYGIRYLEDLGTNHLPFEDRIDPIAKVFPKVTKCNFNNYGAGGGVENKDTLCLLAFNIINEKIYLFLWFWFAFLAVWTGIHCIFRILSGASMKFR